MKTNFSIALTLFALLLTGCGDGSNQAVVAEIGYGELADNAYTNDYFGVTVPVPEDWHAQDRKAIEEMEKAGGDVIAGDDASLRASMEAAEQNTLTLLSVFEQPMGAPVDFNPSVNIIAEKVSQFPGIKTGDDYIFHSKKLLEQAAIPYTFPKPNYDEEVGGTTFRVLECKARMQGMDLTQRFYATRIKDYMFVIVVSHIDDAQAKSLNDILAGVTFK